MPKVTVNDISLYYESHGEGEPLVLVSGFSGDHTVWENMIDRYVKQYRVIVFDNRGIGGSDCPDYPYTAEMMAEDAVGLVQALGLGSAHFVGHSFGGALVQIIAHKHPELVRSLVISNAFLKPNPRAKMYAEGRLELLEAGAPEAAIVKFITLLCWSRDYLSKPGMADALVGAGFFPITITGYRNQLHAVLGFDSTAWAREIHVPCLVMAAGDDILATEEDGRQIASAISNAEYFCFKRVGHVPMAERPELFHALLGDFLARH